MPLISDWQPAQIHEAGVPPSCVSMDEFPVTKQDNFSRNITCNIVGKPASNIVLANFSITQKRLKQYTFKKERQFS